MHDRVQIVRCVHGDTARSCARETLKGIALAHQCDGAGSVRLLHQIARQAFAGGAEVGVERGWIGRGSQSPLAADRAACIAAGWCDVSIADAERCGEEHAVRVDAHAQLDTPRPNVVTGVDRDGREHALGDLADARYFAYAEAPHERDHVVTRRRHIPHAVRLALVARDLGQQSIARDAHTHREALGGLVHVEAELGSDVAWVHGMCRTVGRHIEVRLIQAALVQCRIVGAEHAHHLFTASAVRVKVGLDDQEVGAKGACDVLGHRRAHAPLACLIAGSKKHAVTHGEALATQLGASLHLDGRVKHVHIAV